MRTLLRTLCLALFVALFVGTAGCNTVKGAGEDVERAGEKVKDVAD